MTREQAKREIDSLDYYLQNHTDDYGEESHTAMMMAIKALEREPCGDCIYCHEDSDGYVKPIEKNSHAFIRLGMDGWEISLSAKGWNGSAKIMYCPMCGRKLMSLK